jgi:hypothetical protein
LRFDGFNDAPIAKTNLMDVISMEIHEAMALEVLDVSPVAGCQYVQTRCGQGLMQEVPGVFVQPLPGLNVDVIFLPDRSP